MTKRCFLFFVMFLAATPVRAQDRFDREALLNDIKTLSSDEFEGREAGTVGGAKALAHLKRRFDSIGLQECGNFSEQSFEISGEKEGVNLLGRIEGTDASGRSLVLSAHYDHLGVRRGETYNGADDNASGTAALVAIASYFVDHPLRHALVVAAFDAEEKGLLGARAFLNDPCVPIASISLNINLDMISRSEAGELYAVGIQHYPYLEEFIQGMDTDREFTLLFGHDTPGSGADDWTSASDHGPFHALGIPFIYFGVEDHEGYHHPNDDFEYVTQDFYVSVVDGIIDVIEKIDQNIEKIDQYRAE